VNGHTGRQSALSTRRFVLDTMALGGLEHAVDPAEYVVIDPT
jgi:hypothetical protein